MTKLKMFIEQQLLESLVRYHKPSFDAELGEFERVSSEHNIPLEHLKQKYNESDKIEPLHPKIWEQLHNTDSNDKMPHSKAAALLGKYGRSASRQKKVGALFNRGSVETPIIMHHNGEYHLVAGNTRLMHAKNNGITPKVHIFHI